MSILLTSDHSLSATALKQREKQITLGMVTHGYWVCEVLSAVDSSITFPKIPDTSSNVTKRQFDKAIREWRRDLHAFDDVVLPKDLRESEKVKEVVKQLQERIKANLEGINLGIENRVVVLNNAERELPLAILGEKRVALSSVSSNRWAVRHALESGMQVLSNQNSPCALLRNESPSRMGKATSSFWG